MLPNPMAMNIEKIRVFGVASDVAMARLYLEIGNKIMVDCPLWTTSIRDKFEVRPAIMICPLQAYRAQIQLEGQIRLGPGLSGRPQVARIIQIALFGRLARAVA